MNYCVHVTKSNPCNGTEAVVTELRQRGDAQSSDVIFIATATDGNTNRAKAACDAVALVHNKYHLGHEHPDLDWAKVRAAGQAISSVEVGPSAKAGAYVYAYSKSADDLPFYIGKGTAGSPNRRWCEHFIQAKDISHLSTDCADNKLQKIVQLINSNPDLEAQNICHIVAVFRGEYAQLQAFAVEQFMIQHTVGIFKLTNRTNGNSDHNEYKLRTLSQPCGFIAKGGEAMEFWNHLVSTADNWTHRGLAAGHKSELIKYQMLLQPDFYESFKQQIDEAAGEELQWFGLKPAPEGDLAIDVNLPSVPNICIQFKFKRTDIVCCFNLRAGPQKEHSKTDGETVEPFLESIRKVFGDSAAIAKKDSRRPYFKPFSHSGGKNRIDVYFSAIDYGKTKKIKGCGWMDGASQDLNLVTAFKLVLSRLREPERSDG